MNSCHHRAQQTPRWFILASAPAATGDGVKLAEMKEKLADADRVLAEDAEFEFVAELEKSCATKEDEWATCYNSCFGNLGDHEDFE